MHLLRQVRLSCKVFRKQRPAGGSLLQKQRKGVILNDAGCAWTTSLIITSWMHWPIAPQKLCMLFPGSWDSSFSRFLPVTRDFFPFPLLQGYYFTKGGINVFVPIEEEDQLISWRSVQISSVRVAAWLEPKPAPAWPCVVWICLNYCKGREIQSYESPDPAGFSCKRCCINKVWWNSFSLKIKTC